MIEEGRLYIAHDDAEMKYICVRTEDELKDAAKAILTKQHEGATVEVTVEEVSFVRMQVMCRVLFTKDKYEQDEDVDFERLITLEEYEQGE